MRRRGSHGKKTAYEADARRSRKAAAAFADFISALRSRLSDRPIDVFAHSMGCRVAIGAMAVVPPPPAGASYVRETVLAAPDVSLNDYRRAITRSPRPFAQTTIYVSRYDKALALSEFVHLHHRLGQLAIWRHTVADTTVVDASSAARVNAGHGYAIADEPVIRDIGLTLAETPIPHPAWRRAGEVWTLAASPAPQR